MRLSLRVVTLVISAFSSGMVISDRLNMHFVPLIRRLHPHDLHLLNTSCKGRIRLRDVPQMDSGGGQDLDRVGVVGVRGFGDQGDRIADV